MRLLLRVVLLAEITVNNVSHKIPNNSAMVEHRQEIIYLFMPINQNAGVAFVKGAIQRN